MVPRLRFLIKRGQNVVALDHAPIEWDESSLRWQRSDLYKGLTRDFSLPFEFVKDGAKILRTAYYLEGIEAKAELIVERYISLSEAYSEVYRGDFDFSGFKDREDSVVIPMADLGVEALVKAREKITYELELSEAKYSVTIPKISDTRRASGSLFAPTGDGSLTSLAIIFKGGTFVPDTIAVNDASYGTYGSFEELTALSNNAHFLTSFEDITVSVSGSLRVGDALGPNQLVKSELILVDSDATSLSDVIHRMRITGDGDLAFNFNLGVKPGKRYFLTLRAIAIRFYGSPTVNPDLSHLTVAYSEASPVHEVKAYRASDVFGLLVDKMTDYLPAPGDFEDSGEGTRWKSSLLNRFRNVFITSGEGIRGLEDAKLKTSFKDFFQSMKSVLTACFGVEDGVAVLEDYSYFFNKALTAYFVGDVAEVEISTADKYMYSRIAVGYKDQDYGENLGREEFNTEQQYGTPLTRRENSLDLISPYRADQFGMDKARLDGEESNLEGKDSKTDNDVFLIYSNGREIRPGVFEAQTSGDFQNVTGLSGRANVINLFLSPKRNLLRHSSFLAGSVFPSLGVFKFETSAKDVDLVSEIGGEIVRERANVFTSSLPSPLFLPVVANITTSIGVDALQQLKAKNTGVISFRFRGHIFKGFILSAESNLSRNAEVSLELLLSPDSDLSNLID